MNTFAEKTALVTGASAGIGRAFARELAARGCHLVLTARREERLYALARELERAHAIRSRVIPLDLSEPGSAAALVGACESSDVHVDVLVNNAGATDSRLFVESEWGEHQRFLQLMLNGPVELCRRLLPAMVERGYGRIVNVSSVAGLVHGSYGHSLYGSSKAFLVRFSESLSLELEGAGVHVTATCPGLTHSEFHDVAGVRDRVSKIPELQWMEAEAVVKQALDAVETGKSVVVNGKLNRVATEVARYVPDPLLRRMVKRASLQVSPRRR